MEKSLNEIVLQPPFNCQYCNSYTSTYEDVVNNHWLKCPCYILECPSKCGILCQRQNLKRHLENDCPGKVIPCEYNYAGCKVLLSRQDMSAHMAEKMAVHLSMVSAYQKDQDVKKEELKMKLDQLSIACNAMQHEITMLRRMDKVDIRLKIPPVGYILDKFTQRKLSNDKWYSPQFFSHNCGYSMFLYVHPNGNGLSRNRHVSVYLYVMQGAYDEELTWPLHAYVTIQLLDQRKPRQQNQNDDQCGRDHYTKTFELEKIDRVRIGSTAGGIGHRNFIPLASLEGRYLINDCLHFHVPEVKIINSDNDHSQVL